MAELEETPWRKKRYRIINMLASRAGMDRNDRIDLARAIFRDAEITSYKELDNDELADIEFGLRVWGLVQEIRLANGTLETEAEVLLRTLREPTTAERDAAEEQGRTRQRGRRSRTGAATVVTTAGDAAETGQSGAPGEP